MPREVFTAYRRWDCARSNVFLVAEKAFQQPLVSAPRIRFLAARIEQTGAFNVCRNGIVRIYQLVEVVLGVSEVANTAFD